MIDHEKHERHEMTRQRRKQLELIAAVKCSICAVRDLVIAERCAVCAEKQRQRNRARSGCREWQPGGIGRIPATATAQQRAEHERLIEEKARNARKWTPGSRGRRPKWAAEAVGTPEMPDAQKSILTACKGGGVLSSHADSFCKAEIAFARGVSAISGCGWRRGF